MLNTSSELSDALNPNFLGQRQTSSHAEAAGPQQRTESDAQDGSTGSSAVADAIGPVVDAHRPFRPSLSTRSQCQDPVQLLKGLIQSIASYKAAVEHEKRRRLAWEQKQDLKSIARQTELERQISEMQEEINTLRYALNATQASQRPQPISPASETASEIRAEGLSPAQQAILHDEQGSTARPANSISLPSLKKRASLDTTASGVRESVKLRTCRDGRPQTVQAAMRCHILRCMKIEHDQLLPSSQVETFAHSPTSPVRFVWESTTRKSPHNAMMKKHVVSDMIECQELYPLVPIQEFTVPNLESVFEQAFMTLRQKYANQTGSEEDVLKARERTNIKARKARRLSRKKIKLANRNNARKGHGAYTLKMFDAAFQMECMSSEESSGDEREDGNFTEEQLRRSASKLGTLHVRCLQWRSTRLNRLFQIVDALEEHERSAKPKRGIGRKDRKLGPLKEGNPMPPEGVSNWMVSKRWLERLRKVSPHFDKILIVNIKKDTDNHTDIVLTMLGDESEPDEEERSELRNQEQSQNEGRSVGQADERRAHLGPISLTASLSEPTLPSGSVAMNEILLQYHHTEGLQWPSGSIAYAPEYYGVPHYSQTITNAAAPFTPHEADD